MQIPFVLQGASVHDKCQMVKGKLNRGWQPQMRSMTR